MMIESCWCVQLFLSTDKRAKVSSSTDDKIPLPHHSLMTRSPPPSLPHDKLPLPITPS